MSTEIGPATGVNGNSSAVGGVRWKRADHISIRVTGPIAKTRSLIRQKRRVRVEGFAVADRQAELGIITHDRRQEGTARDVPSKRYEQQ